MGTNSLINLLQAHHRTIEGVTAYDVDSIPNGDVNYADMPYVLTYPSSGNWIQFGQHGFNKIERNLVITVIVAPQTAGVQSEILAKINDLIDIFGKSYIENIMLQAPTSTKNEVMIDTLSLRDSGYLDSIQLGGAFYQGFQFDMMCWEKGILWNVEE